VITEDRERWLGAGSPPVPTMVVDGTPHVLQHPAQAAALLGIELPPALRDASQTAWDIDALADAWVELLAATSWDVLVEPLPRLGRTSLALGVDTMIGIAALRDSLASGWFHWPGNAATGETGDAAVVEYEAAIVGTIAGRDDLLAFVRPVAGGWRDAIVEHSALLRDEPERIVRAPRGELALVSLLEAQRLHAAQHLRQATTFAASRDCAVPELDLASLPGLQLPELVY
jgi:hypothetical protein